MPSEIVETGMPVGESGKVLQDELTEKVFNPTKVKPIWDFKGHSGYAVIEFTKVSSLSLKENIHHKDGMLYGWIARKNDYNLSGIVGKFLKKKRDLKSISELQEVDKRLTLHLVENIY
ncbi:unnamed protein product, partial [Thlaspi arvense]